MTDLRGLPLMLAELARKTDGATALRLVAAKGGQRVYIPRTLPFRTHWLFQVLGRDGTAVMIDLYGGEMLEIPTARALKSVKGGIVESMAKGQSSNNQIAGDYGVTCRYVRKLRQEYDLPAPLPLFDRD